MTPRVFRVMKPDSSGSAPLVEPSARGLGVRPLDLAPCERGLAHPRRGGMSVAPTLLQLPPHRVPERLGHMVEGASGHVSDRVWVVGAGAFTNAPFAQGLVLRVTSPSHGLVEPAQQCPFPRIRGASRGDRQRLDGGGMMALEALVLRLHDQLARGASEDELEVTRLSLDEAWAQMPENERRLYAGLLHDLKSLRGRDVVLEALRSTDEFAQIAKSREHAARAEWEQALRSLRGLIPARSKSEVARLRAEAWKELGFASIAMRFARLARQVGSMFTPFHAKYWAHSLRLSRHDGVDAISRSIGNARVDLNPHQVDAALFALRSPYSKGVLLADEVGLGKTIEAWLILAQNWAERRRRILLIVPATLRKQWQVELEDKFFLPSIILEAQSFNARRKKGIANPFEVDDRIVICSYQFVVREARPRSISRAGISSSSTRRIASASIYKGTKTAEGSSTRSVRHESCSSPQRRSRTTLLELYGLVSILDPELVRQPGSVPGAVHPRRRLRAARRGPRERLQHVCKRTLRRQVLEYIPFTERFTHTADFIPSEAEERASTTMFPRTFSARSLVALPNTRRKLITLIMRKLLASSSAAIGATLQKFVDRLNEPDHRCRRRPEDAVADDFETLDELGRNGRRRARPAPATPSAQPYHLVAPRQKLGRAGGASSDSSSSPAWSRATRRRALRDALPKAFDQAAAEGRATQGGHLH